MAAHKNNINSLLNSHLVSKRTRLSGPGRPDNGSDTGTECSSDGL